MLLLASIALLWLQRSSGLLWCTAYVAVAVLGSVWQFVAMVLRDEQLLSQIAAEVSKTIVCDEADVHSHLSKDERVRYVQTHIHGTSVQATLQKEQARIRASDSMHFIRKDLRCWDKSKNGYALANNHWFASGQEVQPTANGRPTISL